MFKRILGILQMAGTLTKAVIAGTLRNSGIGALYLGASTLLAGMLLAAYLSYAWNITPDKWYRAYAILQGYDLSAIQKAEQDAAAQASLEKTLEKRAAMLRNDEYNREIARQVESYALPPEDPPPQPPPQPSAAEEISALDKRIKDALAKSQSAGLDEVIRILETVDSDKAKNVIKQLWKDGATQRVLTILNDMQEKRKDAVLDAFRESDEEELKMLTEILQKIGDGEPKASIVKNASAKPAK